MNDRSSQDNAPSSELFVTDEKKYGKDYQKHLLAQYQLCVEMADRISSRRSSANSFFLSLNTLLITVMGVLLKIGSSFFAFNILWFMVACFAGILFCWCWSMTLRCYRELNTAKFKIINAIEKRLPVKAFETEWNCLNPRNKKTKYPQLTRIERWVPAIFAALYIILMIIAIALFKFSSLNV